MSKIALTPSATGTGVFTISSPATNTDRTLTLPDEAGTVLTSASSITQNAGPAFSAWQSTQQALSAYTQTKILFQTEEYDTNNNFDSSRFTPTVAGYYLMSGKIAPLSSYSAGITAIYKNSGAYKYGSYNNNSTGVAQPSMSCIVYCNGSTDYVELYAALTIAQDTAPEQVQTWFQGILVRAA